MQSEVLAYRDLPDINDTNPVSSDDDACLAAIHEVLKQHNATSRFGVVLLHKHFDVYDGEMLLETCDHKSRILTIQPVAAKEIDSEKLMPTTWRFRREADQGADPNIAHQTTMYCIMRCDTVTFCVKAPNGHYQQPIHNSSHTGQRV